MYALLRIKAGESNRDSGPVRPRVWRYGDNAQLHGYVDLSSATRTMAGKRRSIYHVWWLPRGVYGTEEPRDWNQGYDSRFLVSEGGMLTEVTRAEADAAIADWRRPLGVDVLSATRSRIAWVFDHFGRVYLSGPSGKDSSVMMHLACEEARRRRRRVGVLYVDLEAQYKATIDHVREMFDLYSDVIDPHWVALPLQLRNAVSMGHPYWRCWDPECASVWVRQRDPVSVADPGRYPFFRVGMEFEEFIADFSDWYADGTPTACLVGIRTDESLNRWRAITGDRKSRIDGRHYTSWKGGAAVNVYPIYDWKAQDIWTFYGKTGLPHNRIYDLMHQAGLSIHQMRICQPYGDDQRRGLNPFHVLEPETWSRVVQRVAGARSGALYANLQGNILGNGKVELPDGHTWESFAVFLLGSLPEHEADHYRDKFAVFIQWWRARGVPMYQHHDDAPDALRTEHGKKLPTWHRIVKVLLKNDRMCRGLSFSQHVSGAYEKYKQLMRGRRNEWQIFPTS